MTTRTIIIGDVKAEVICTETHERYIALIQRDDIIVLSIDQAREIAAVIDEV